MNLLSLMLRAVAGGVIALSLTAPVAPVGTVIAVRHSAAIVTPPDPAITARPGTPIHTGDLVTTGADSAVRAQFADGTLFSLGANARATIDGFAYDAAKPASSVSLSFLRGAFRFVSGKPTHANPGQPAIRTPVAAIGIRGTIVTGVIGPEALAYYRRIDPTYTQDRGEAETATLILLSDTGVEGGGIDISGPDGVTSLRTSGQALFFRRRGAPPLPPQFLSPDMRARIEQRAAPASLGREPGGGPQPGRQGGGPQPGGGSQPGQQGGLPGQGPNGPGPQGPAGPAPGGGGPPRR